jgi:hypothetical protein
MEARARQENEGGRSHRRASRATTNEAERRRTTGGVAGWPSCATPLAVEPEQGVARRLVHQPEREPVHGTRGVSNQPAATIMEMP